MYTGIHHCAFATGDMETTVRWWRDLLGLRLVYAAGEPGYRQYFFEVSPDSLISFFEWPAVERVRPKTHGAPARGSFVFDHVCLGVDSEEALWDMAARLAAAEQPVSDIIDHGFVRSLYTHDPNGIAVEFSFAVEAHDPHRQPRLLDRDPPPSRRDGSDPDPGYWPPAEPIPASERTLIQGEGWEDFARPPGGKG